MSGFLDKFNMDEVFMRNLIISMLRSLNDKLTYFQVNDQQEVLQVYVPFYFSLTGDEPFLQDEFLRYVVCKTDEPVAEGNFDVLPRGMVVYKSSTIDTQALTNKYVRMSYAQEDVKGEMKTFSSYTNSIPLNVSFDVMMKVDTLLDGFKLYQSVIRTFYKTYSFSFDFEGMRIPANIGFPENYEITKPFTFTYSQNDPIEFNFSVEIETYLPDKDLSTERFRGNLMQAGIRVEEILDRKVSDKPNREIL